MNQTLILDTLIGWLLILGGCVAAALFGVALIATSIAADRISRGIDRAVQRCMAACTAAFRPLA